MIFPFCDIICLIIRAIVVLGAYNFAEVFWGKTVVAVQEIKSFILYLWQWKGGKRLWRNCSQRGTKLGGVYIVQFCYRRWCKRFAKPVPAVGLASQAASAYPWLKGLLLNQGTGSGPLSVVLPTRIAVTQPQEAAVRVLLRSLMQQVDGVLGCTRFSFVSWLADSSPLA